MKFSVGKEWKTEHAIVATVLVTAIINGVSAVLNNYPKIGDHPWVFIFTATLVVATLFFLPPLLVRWTASVESPQKRAYVDDTPYDLRSQVFGKTNVAAELDMQRYNDAWLKVPQAKLIRMDKDGDRGISVLVEVGGPQVVSLQLNFAAPWFPQLRLYEKGQIIGAEGKIAAIRDTDMALDPHIILDDCELLQASQPS